MRSILNESHRAAICSRVRSLSASSTARWGRMGVAGMLQHLGLSARMAVGELPVASSNKRAFQVFPLVWYDDFTLHLGDSLPSKIDEGLASCRYAVVILSPSFIAKPWTRRELDGRWDFGATALFHCTETG